MAWDLASSASDSDAILVIKPNLMIGHFSVFSNFVLSDATGTPRWADMEATSDWSASDALCSILSQVSYLDCGIQKDVPIALLGFSKGCVVLSAILRERNPQILQRVDAVGFIDPGTHSPASTFPFKDEDYSLFPSDLPVRVWSSPYQFSDPRRPWLRTEITEFVNHSCATHTLIGMETIPSMLLHFQCLELALTQFFNS
jgi:hypothetical protein